MDFNNDKKIEANDVEAIMTQMPLQKMTEKDPKENSFPVICNLDHVNLDDRFQSLDEIQRLNHVLFEKKSDLTFDEFKEITENSCSDLFITVTVLIQCRFIFY